MYCRAVRQRVIEGGDKRDICSVLYCSGAKAREEQSETRQDAETIYIVLTCLSERTSSAFAVLFYRKFRYYFRGPSQVVWTRETGK